MAWATLLGLVIGVVALPPLSSYLFPTSPQIEFIVLTEANVFEINRPLPELTVYFRNEDIASRNLNLRIMQVKIQNVGRSDILQVHYDQSSPWGLRVTDGTIVDVRVSDGSSRYLLDNVSPSIQSPDSIEFQKIILESMSYFTLEILVLHDRSTFPWLESVGKIAGVHSVSIVRQADLDRSLIYRMRQGHISAYLDAINTVLGLISLLVLALLIVIGVVAVLWRILRFLYRLVKASRWLSQNALMKDTRSNFLADEYTRYGSTQLDLILDTITKREALRNSLTYPSLYDKTHGAVSRLKESKYIEQRDDGEFYVDRQLLRVLRKMRTDLGGPSDLSQGDRDDSKTGGYEKIAE
jgi:hypothetical protein